MKFGNSLKFKLVLVLFCISLIPLLSLAFFQGRQFHSVIDGNIKGKEVDIANALSQNMDSWINSKVSQLTNTLKANPGFKKLNMEEINSVLKPIRESDSELETAASINKDGIAININNNAPINLADREYFKKSKETKKNFISDVNVSRATGIRVIAICIPVIDDNNNFQGAIFSNVTVKSLENSVGSVKLGKTGYAFLMSAKGEYLFHPVEDNIGKNYKELSKSESKEKVFTDEILSKENGFVAYKDDDGEEKIGAFSTVPSTGWKVVVTAPSHEVYEELKTTELIISILIMITAIIIIIVSLFIASSIAKPVRAAAEHLNVLANADFTQEIPEKFKRRKDELGLLAKSIDIMSKSIRAVLHDVIEETSKVRENISSSYQNLGQLSAQIEDVSATTEEMSAGMEETAATAEQMNATSEEIEGAVESIAIKAQNGSEIAGEISKRAQGLKDSAVISQNTAYEIRQSIDADIRASIEQSKAVEHINALTEAILQITSQTNLLALNAAIEAARAGEAGKGFAVVADEIRKLAENSKMTVNEIQSVTKVVVSSVQSLAQSSEKALNFIDKTVINDYKSMVSTGEKYFNDAEAIQDMVTDFSATAQELSASIQSMTKAISEVTISNNEGAQGTQNIAEKASDVMLKSANVSELMKATEINSVRLEKAVSKFKI